MVSMFGTQCVATARPSGVLMAHRADSFKDRTGAAFLVILDDPPRSVVACLTGISRDLTMRRPPFGLHWKSPSLRAVLTGACGAG
jgi:hypothetical protein